MDDLISRQAAIDAICGIKRTDNWQAAICMAVYDLPSAQQWIPCSERLPDDERESYWVCTDTGYQCECRWTNNRFGIAEADEWGWSIFDTPQYSKVIAWMPLPEPYTEEDNAE